MVVNRVEKAAKQSALSLEEPPANPGSEPEALFEVASDVAACERATATPDCEPSAARARNRPPPRLKETDASSAVWKKDEEPTTELATQLSRVTPDGYGSSSP